MERNDQKIALIATYMNLIVESDESSDDDSDSAEILNLLVKNNVERVPKRVRCQNYVENVVWHYTGNAFKSHFRLSRPTFTFYWSY